MVDIPFNADTTKAEAKLSALKAKAQAVGKGMELDIQRLPASFRSSASGPVSAGRRGLATIREGLEKGQSAMGARIAGALNLGPMGVAVAGVAAAAGLAAKALATLNDRAVALAGAQASASRDVRNAQANADRAIDARALSALSSAQQERRMIAGGSEVSALRGRLTRGGAGTSLDDTSSAAASLAGRTDAQVELAERMARTGDVSLAEAAKLVAQQNIQTKQQAARALAVATGDVGGVDRAAARMDRAGGGGDIISRTLAGDQYYALRRTQDLTGGRTLAAVGREGARSENPLRFALAELTKLAGEEAAIAEAKREAQLGLWKALDAMGQGFGLGTAAGNESRAANMRAGAFAERAMSGR